MNRHIILYVENSSPKHKIFKSKKSLRTFIVNFHKKYLNMIDDGYWIDYVITDIVGEILNEQTISRTYK